MPNILETPCDQAGLTIFSSLGKTGSVGINPAPSLLYKTIHGSFYFNTQFKKLPSSITSPKSIRRFNPDHGRTA